MKNNSLLLLASLAVFATSASAAQSQFESETVVLPTYVVGAPRHTAVEQRITASLNQFRQQAQTPVAVVPESLALKGQSKQGSGLAQAAQDLKTVRVAKS